ncbi:MAG TPA: XrtA/PEP-CTERM system histidine kinase PrsK [Verrucomicrobiae bacterium]|nr:XrtA/PEP-CTERM system histidine kinase PrsK [Verrucomicrobiae bacterium]
MDTSVILDYLSALCAAVLALIVAVRAGRSVPRWLFVAGMAGLALERVFSALAVDSVLLEDKAYWEVWRLLALSCLPGVWVGFSLVYGRGNAGELLRRWYLWLFAAALAPVLLAAVFREGLLTYVGATPQDNHWVLGLGRPGVVLYMMFLVSLVVALMNLERTYRAAVGTMRWRIKFMVLGLGMLFVVRAYTSAEALIFHTVNLRLHGINGVALILASALVMRTLTRSGHFEVSVYPSRAVLNSSVTVLLAGIYLVLVGALAKAMAFLPGGGSFEAKALGVLVAMVILAMLLMSDRLRARVNHFVSRHFRRPVHDYPRVWRTFAEATARCLEGQMLTEAVARLVSDVFQALSVTVWLTDESRTRLRFAASTSQFEAGAVETGLPAGESAQVLQGLRKQSEPVDIETARQPWAAALRQLHPDEFKKGGHRVCAPILAGEDILGIILIGDRVGGEQFSGQDIELLKAIAEQAGASLLNRQLAERLAEAKQFEAFQTMAAFFVHDLKNTAATLSLMLKNLPVHFDDPEFRQDALGDIARTGKQLEDLIGRLNLLRQEFKVLSVECDLNELVTDALQGQDDTPGVEVVKELHPVPMVRLDPTGMRTVITNLVLNAREAVGRAGRIVVATGRSNGWATVAVSDNGCGMAPEFLRDRLFRPFQTTKKNGVGIGLFHCKRIVEAHHGRIDVESQDGKGTAFRVSLPVSG